MSTMKIKCHKEIVNICFQLFRLYLRGVFIPTDETAIFFTSIFENLKQYDHERYYRIANEETKNKS